MTIRSFTGYLNTDLFGTENPVATNTFTVDPADQIDILMSDGADDLVVEGDSDGVSNDTEDSEDPQGDQLVFARDGSGTVIFDGETFYLETSFVFEINGELFTGYTFEEDSGGGSVDFTILPPNLPAGTAVIQSVDFTPSPDSVPYSELTSGDEIVDDTPYSNLDLSGDDTIIAGDGDDIVNADGGNDVVLGGAGDDILSGGAGDDIIYGDGAPSGINYSGIPDPDGGGTAVDDGDDLSSGFSLNSGGVQADFTFTDDVGSPTTSEFEFNNSDTQYTEGLNDGQGGSNNAIFLGGSGGVGATSNATISFSSTDTSVASEVENVNFRINDIDDSSWQDVVTIRAFDLNGDPVEVTLTAGANHILSDTDGDGINDTVTAIDGSGNQTPGSAFASLLVEIAGPVASVEIDYANLGTGGQRIDLTEVFFQTIPTEDADGFNDMIDGGSGDDIIYGNRGDDKLDGGSDDDTIDGGTGDDEIFISSGTDDIAGGEGADTFTAIGGSSLTGETISVQVDNNGDGTITKTNDGTTDTVTSVETFIADEAAAENDQITITADNLTAADISGIDDTATGIFVPLDGSAPVSFGGPGEPTFSELLAGTYVRLDGSTVRAAGDYEIDGGDESGQIGNIAFENFENIDFTIVCFADGTLIKTDHGLRPVETLRAGDIVLTADNGPQPIRWTGNKQIDAATLAAKPNLRPIRIKAGALADNVPARDLIVSPQHRILVRSKIAIRMFDAGEVFVPAKHLLGLDGVDVAEDMNAVTYVHIMCDDHEIVEAEGALAETLHTGTEAMKAMTDDARQEIDDIFGDAPYLNRPLARVTPKGKLAKLLIERHIKNDQQLYQPQI